MLVGRQVPECLVWSGGIERRLPLAQGTFQRRQVKLAAVTFPELAPTCAIEPFDPTVQLRTPRWQHIQRNPALLTRQFEPGHECRPTIDLDCLDRARHPRHQLIEERYGRPGCGLAAYPPVPHTG